MTQQGPQRQRNFARAIEGPVVLLTNPTADVFLHCDVSDGWISHACRLYRPLPVAQGPSHHPQRRPASMLGTRATAPGGASDVDRPTSQQSSSSIPASGEKENTRRPSPRAPVLKSGSLLVALKCRSIVAVPAS